MKKYDVTVTGHYKKTIAVSAKSPAHAREKIETIIFDTDLIDFADEDLVSGEIEIDQSLQDDPEEQSVEERCSDCMYLCPMCGTCICEE